MKLINIIKKIRHNVYIEFCRHIPLEKNKIIFWANSFKQYRCSPKYITEYILKNYPNQFDLVWVFEPEITIPEDLDKKVRLYIIFQWNISKNFIQQSL